MRHRCASGRSDRQGGYSLLEVMIALAILALAVALSIPSMAALHERQQVHEAFAALNAWMLDRRTGARLAGAPVDFPAEPLSGLTGMPRGWQAELVQPWTLHPSGACSEGRIRIASPRGRIWERPVSPPACRAEFEVAER